MVAVDVDQREPGGLVDADMAGKSALYQLGPGQVFRQPSLQVVEHEVEAGDETGPPGRVRTAGQIRARLVRRVMHRALGEAVDEGEARRARAEGLQFEAHAAIVDEPRRIPGQDLAGDSLV